MPEATQTIPAGRYVMDCRRKRGRYMRWVDGRPEVISGDPGLIKALAQEMGWRPFNPFFPFLQELVVSG